MRCPTLADLPPPPAGKSGWPWTVETPPMPAAQPDGRPWPRISIVTPSYNQGRYIEETIRSVLLQGYPDLEYVVMDGGSTDESVAIIEKYSDWLTCWTSGPDEGQSDAILKGLNKTSGAWWNWLNSDDYLLPEALASVAACAVLATSETLAIAGGCRVVDACGKSTGKVFVSKAPRSAADFFSEGSPPVIPQPSTFLRAELVPDRDLHYVMDWALYLRASSMGPRAFVASKVEIAAFRMHEASKTAEGALSFQLEALRVMESCKFEGHELNTAISRGLTRLRSRMALGLASGSISELLQLPLKHPMVLKDRMYWGAVRRCVLPTTGRSKQVGTRA